MEIGIFNMIGSSEEEEGINLPDCQNEISCEGINKFLNSPPKKQRKKDRIKTMEEANHKRFELEKLINKEQWEFDIRINRLKEELEILKQHCQIAWDRM